MRTARQLGLITATVILAIGGGLADARPALAAGGNTYTVVHQATGNCATKLLPTIGAALACANADNPPSGNYDTVYIWQGVYPEHDLLVNSNVHIIGRGRNVAVDAQSLGRVFIITGNHDVTIDGLTMRHGLSNASSAVAPGTGGGIIDSNRGTGSLTLRNDIITNNRAGWIGSTIGGGSFIDTSTATIDNVTFSYNTVMSTDAAYGGGLYVQSTGATITNTTFTRNAAVGGTAGAGGVYLIDATLANDVIAYNTVTGGSGSSPQEAYAAGVYAQENLDSLSDTYSNNTATGGYNTAGGNGGSAFAGGVYLQTAGTLVLDNINSNIVKAGGSSNPANNDTDAFAGGLYIQTTGHLTATSVSFNTASNLPSASALSSVWGGGIYNQTNATLTDVSVRGNHALGRKAQGGGIYNQTTLRIEAVSTISQNEAPGALGKGGGLYDQTSATSDGSNTIKGNLAGIQQYNNCYPFPDPGVSDCSP